MCDDATQDARGVIHRVRTGPEPFTTMAGGIPGQTWCRTWFYANELGPKSCTLVGMVHPYAEPMSRTEAQVNCMTCLVKECL